MYLIWVCKCHWKCLNVLFSELQFFPAPLPRAKQLITTQKEKKLLKNEVPINSASGEVRNETYKSETRHWKQMHYRVQEGAKDSSGCIMHFRGSKEKSCPKWIQKLILVPGIFICLTNSCFYWLKPSDPGWDQSCLVAEVRSQVLMRSFNITERRVPLLLMSCLWLCCDYSLAWRWQVKASNMPLLTLSSFDFYAWPEVSQDTKRHIEKKLNGTGKTEEKELIFATDKYALQSIFATNK